MTGTVAEEQEERAARTERLNRQICAEKPEEAEGVGAEEVAGGADEHASLADLVKGMSPSDRRLLDWHWANLEYGCSARLSDVSLAHWNQVRSFAWHFLSTTFRLLLSS